MERFDYRSMSFYQIWIRSFMDGNGDGIGDLYGVCDRLEYIRSLGVDGIWFSPIYPSPNADYGYDISDYKNIHPDYGTLEQFKKVLDKAHQLGLKVLMDLVINHTSDEHPWFIESCKGKDNPYSDYYIWRDPVFKNGRRLPPNNWFSQFEGRAWEYNESRGQYYLHIFARKQPDLNMDNPMVRREVESIMRFWLDLGVDGFREDVITYISKVKGLPNGLPFLPQINGLPFYNEGPNLMRYLRRFRALTDAYGAIQIGEAPMTSVKGAARYIAGPSPVLDMVIHFNHMTADCVITEYMHHPFSLRKLKHAFSKWQYAFEGKAWNALYLENHDHPRVICRYGSLQHHTQSGKALAAAYIFQKGCPFIYQGQEIGMTNIQLHSIDDYLDVASRNAYHTYMRWAPEKFRLARIHLSSRDSARTPMQWSREENAGFTTAVPWFHVNPDYKTINVQDQENDPASLLNFYRQCLTLRKESEILLWGTYREYFPLSGRLYMYERSYKGKRMLILISFSRRTFTARLPKGWRKENLQLVLDSYPEEKAELLRLRPYEVQILLEV